MKKVVWILGLLLLLSFVFPNGLPGLHTPTDTDVTPVVPAGPTDAKIVELLTGSDAADRARIVGVYSGLSHVLNRDGGKKLITTTEKFAMLQANTLGVAIDTPGEYPGLDTAIESVFLTAVGSDDVVPVTPELVTKLVDACAVIVNSASTAK